MKRHTIVCGLGHVGFRVAILLRRLGEDVAVVTKAPRGEWVEHARNEGIDVHVGDARDARLLENVGISRATAVLALTDDDGTNLEIALDARAVRPNVRVVTRLFDSNLARSAETAFRIDRAFAMAQLAAPAFAAAAMDGNVLTAFELDHTAYLYGLIDADEGTVLVGKRPSDVRTSHGAVVCRATTDGALVTPDDAPFAVGDRVAVLAERTAFERLAGHGVSTVPLIPRAVRVRLSLLKRSWTGAPAALRLTIVAQVLISMVSILLFQHALGLTFTEALYFVVTTLTTTGYGDISSRGHGPFILLYTSALMLLGSTTMAVIFAFVTDFMVRERFRELTGKADFPAT
jgi:Trk K+ transport system NAD-binding subunit